MSRSKIIRKQTTPRGGSVPPGGGVLSAGLSSIRIGGTALRSGNLQLRKSRRAILTTAETVRNWENQRLTIINPTQPCVSSLLKPENFAARFRFFIFPCVPDGVNTIPFLFSTLKVYSSNRCPRGPVGAAEQDRLTWHSYYYPAAPFMLFFHLKIIPLRRRSEKIRARLLGLKSRAGLSDGGGTAVTNLFCGVGGTELRPFLNLRSYELIHPKLIGPLIEIHKALFWVGGETRTFAPVFSHLHHLKITFVPIFNPPAVMCRRFGVQGRFSVWRH